MTKLTDPGELEIVKRVYGFEGYIDFNNEKSEEEERREKRDKLIRNRAK